MLDQKVYFRWRGHQYRIWILGSEHWELYESREVPDPNSEGMVFWDYIDPVIAIDSFYRDLQQKLDLWKNTEYRNCMTIQEFLDKMEST